MTIFAAFSPIGSGPQIKIGNDLVERLQEEGNRLRIEVVGLAYNRAGDGSTGEPSTRNPAMSLLERAPVRRK